MASRFLTKKSKKYYWFANGLTFRRTKTLSELSFYLPGIFLIYGIFFLQNATPGPNVLAVIGTSMSAGRLSGFAVSFGVAAGTLTWSTASVLGLSAIVANYGQFLFYIKIAGGCYLLYLALKAFRSACSTTDFDALSIQKTKHTFFGYFRKGYLLNLTNPKAALGWIAIVSLGLESNSPLWVLFAIIIGTTILSLGVHIIYTLLFSSPRMVSVYIKARRPIQGVLGGLFSFASYKLFTARVD